jgi:hypothetical protein
MVCFQGSQDTGLRRARVDDDREPINRTVEATNSCWEFLGTVEQETRDRVEPSARLSLLWWDLRSVNEDDRERGHQVVCVPVEARKVQDGKFLLKG